MNIVILSMSWPEAVAQSVGAIATAAVIIVFFWALTR